MEDATKKLLAAGGFGGAMYGMGHVHGSSRPAIGPNTELETIAETTAQNTLGAFDVFTVLSSAVFFAVFFVVLVWALRWLPQPNP